MKPSERDFWNEHDPGDLEYKPGKLRGGQEIGGHAPPYRAHPLSRGPLKHPPTTDFFHLYSPTYPKNIHGEDRSGVPPPQASVATKTNQDPIPAPCRRGDPSPVATSSSRRYPWRGGSSSPSGLRVCTSSYVFDLSLVFLIWHDLDVSRALLL